MSRRPTTVYGTAGASAQLRANQLRRDELTFQHHRAARRAVPIFLLWCSTAAVLSLLLPTFAACVLALYVPWRMLRSLYAPGPDVQRWRAGAAGERRTAKLLAAARGWTVLHDRAIPHSRANLDHLCLVPDGRGAVLVDTKTTRGKGTVGIKGDTLVIGKSNYPRAIPAVLHEAESAQRALGVPVHAIIAVHGATVPSGQLRHSSGVLVIAAADIRHALGRVRYRADDDMLSALTLRATLTLPEYGG